MRPGANRWRPRRAGIINLYEYANQVFDFAGGRLLLRGHNTSGKTKALELLLPFCLDGDIRPTKLDPFASGAKDMRWNLVGCIDREQRDGYVWLEFERLDETGATRRLTAGIGMHANRGLPKVTRWYFVARERSVGGDLQLLRGEHPIGKAELAAALGDDGEVLDSPRDYRARLNDLAVEVGRNVQLLDRELAEADMGAYASRGEDGLLLVRITETGGEQTLAEVLDTLDAEIADREQILTAEERRVFSDALVEEIADHLRQRMHEVRGRVERMNVVLRRSPTAAGKIVELEWQPLEDDEGTQRAALALLRRDVQHLGGESRGELVTFFRRRIEAARREHAFGAEPRPMADTLMSAFDYRRWFAFGLHERSDSGRVRLTKRRHAVGSGGEQSVLIHLPLFAAAAALYGESHAPRLVMLDEALSGIDDDTRERVLEATVAFDLDVVMTSHELWGTYRSVPQLAIYQLHRENGTFGVHAIPFVWDGDVLHELEQSELLV